MYYFNIILLLNTDTYQICGNIKKIVSENKIVRTKISEKLLMASDQIMHVQPESLGISEKFLDLCSVSIDEIDLSIIIFCMFV